MITEPLVKKILEKPERKACENCGSYAAVRTVQCMDRQLSICASCFSRLPAALRKHTKKIASDEMIGAVRAVSSVPVGPVIDFLDGFSICSSSVGINGTYYPFDAIRSFRIGFVPVKRVDADDVLGYPYAVVELSSPHMLIQEPLSRSAVVFKAYEKNGKAVFVPGKAIREAEKAVADAAGKNFHILKKNGRLVCCPEGD